ncbi:MAG TPA: hypothetical protein VFH51_09300 [Myxococcota bacterium]|nr:hypothetical protein [Myxococcota bacterium]
MRVDLESDADWVEPACIEEVSGEDDEILDLKVSLAALLSDLDLGPASAPEAALPYAPPPVWLYRV